MRTLSRRFDNLYFQSTALSCNKSVTLVLDGTFFGRTYGYFCFSDGKNLIHYQEIKTETVAVLRRGLRDLEEMGYSFNSFTLDGKRGFINNLKKLYPGKPIQMCHFHQKAIIRRYLTDKPKSNCAIDLKNLMKGLSTIEPQEFIDQFFKLKEKHHLFLLKRNNKQEFKHKAVRSAFASLIYNLEYLFTYKEHPHLNIPNTTNDLEGKFSHLKEKIKIHRGLRIDKKKKAIKFLLENYQEK